ncbi:MAG: hypothetical protein WAW69_15895 [Polaromonas sp.]
MGILDIRKFFLMAYSLYTQPVRVQAAMVFRAYQPEGDSGCKAAFSLLSILTICLSAYRAASLMPSRTAANFTVPVH